MMTHPNAQLPNDDSLPSGEGTAGVNSAKEYGVARDLRADAATQEDKPRTASGSDDRKTPERVVGSMELGRQRVDMPPVSTSPKKHLTPRSTSKEFIFPKSSDPQ